VSWFSTHRSCCLLTIMTQGFRSRNQAAERQRRQAYVDPSYRFRMRSPARGHSPRLESIKQVPAREERSHAVYDQKGTSTKFQPAHSTSPTSVRHSGAVQSHISQRRHHTHLNSRGAVQKRSAFACQKQRLGWRKRNRRHRQNHRSIGHNSDGATLANDPALEPNEASRQASPPKSVFTARKVS